MHKQGEESANPAAQQAAEEWRRRFGREGHEGSYAPHEEGEEPVNKRAGAPEEPSQTSR